MTLRKTFALFAAALALCALSVPLFAQERGKAEMKAGSDTITVDYGKVALRGRDMLSQLKVGTYWRLGANEATVIKSPVALTFGGKVVPKGNYVLHLKRVAQDSFALTFNSAPPAWGSNEPDVSKEVASIPLKKETAATSVETLSIALSGAPGSGALTISWGTTKLSAGFSAGK